MQGDSHDTLEALERLAESRREAVSRKIEVALPNYIRSIVGTEFTINFNPRLLPYSQVDSSTLLSALKDKFNLRFALPDLNVLHSLGVNPSRFTEISLVDLLLKNTSELNFINGSFPTRSGGFVPIRSLGFQQESITANAGGLTDVAEVIVSEAFELLWRSSGVNLSWESDVVRQGIRLKSYGSHTKVDFGFDLIDLVSPKLSGFLKKNIVSGQNFGASIMSFSTYDDFRPRPSVSGPFFLDEMNFRVKLFDNRTGASEERTIRIDVTTRDDLGRGVADVISEMPFDQHRALIEGIIESMGK